MNHRTRLDWLYFWLALWQMNPWLLTSNKIALKELLRYIPGAGNLIHICMHIKKIFIRVWYASKSIYIFKKRFKYRFETFKQYDKLLFSNGSTVSSIFLNFHLKIKFKLTYY